jgi:hypothetical protein
MKQTVTASAVNGKNGRDRDCKAEAWALATMVSWVVAAAPAGVTVAGAKEHVTSAGSPEQAKLTGAANPFTGVTDSVTVPWPPESTVSEAGEAPSVKLGSAAMV